MMPTHHKNRLHILETAPARMHTAQAKPGFNSPKHPTFNQHLWTNKRFSAAASNMLHLFSWLQTPTSFSHLCHFFQKAQIFLSLLVNNQSLMQAAHNKCFMEDEIFLTQWHIVYYPVYVTAVKQKSVYIDIPIFWDRMPYH